jgi:sugar phosphate isomerase/epimerase
LAALNRDVDYEIGCAIDYGVGVEVQGYAMPKWLGKDLTAELNRMNERLAVLEGPIGIHGPFLDTCHYSLDPAVRDVARMRYLEALDIASALNAEFMVLHSQYNTQVKLPDYTDIYHRQSLPFWKDLIKEADKRAVNIYVENMFEDAPEPLRNVVEAIDHPRLRIVLDVAHSALYSDRDVSEWVDAFAPYLAYVHLNDCNLVYDDHLGLGDGKLDLPRALTLIEAAAPNVCYGLETNIRTESSLQYLGLTKRSAAG